MPRALKDSKLDTRTARSRLKPRGKPYWRAIDRNLHVGYRRGKTYGRWVVRVYLGGQQYRVETIGTADDHADADGLTILDWHEAQAKARRHQVTVERELAGVEEPAAPYTVADAIKSYAAWLEQHRRTSALKDLGNANRAHIELTLGRVELAKLTTEQLAKWHHDLACKLPRVRTKNGAEQRHREIGDDPEAARRRRDSANRVRTILFAALNRAFRDGKVASDAAWRRVRPFSGTTTARVRYLQIDECTRLLNASEPDLRQLLRGALVTGARYSELTRANTSDFDPDASALLVRKSKNGKPRWIPLDPEGARFLASLAAGRHPGEPLFIRADGGRWRPSNAARPLQAACQAAKIEPTISFHILRHTWASLRIMAGMPLMVAGQILGHSDTRMVEKHYGHLAQSFVREAVCSTALDLGPIDDTTVAPLRRGATS
jgi:integrase